MRDGGKGIKRRVMKVIVVEREYGRSGTEEGWYLLADSAVTNTGKPFYLPEKLGRVSVCLSAAVRISRLGKSVSSKFASRYYTEVAPCLHFNLPDYREKLREKGLPDTGAMNFDRSLFVGEFLPVEDMKEISLYINEEKKCEIKLDTLPEMVDNFIGEISKLNTIKMGDLIIPGIGGRQEIKEGDKLIVEVNGEEGFYVKIK